MTGDRLLDEILAAPDSDDARLVWADREGGERGELVVLQCALARRDLPRADRRRMRAREQELLVMHARRWSGLDNEIARAPVFVRGFVDRAEVELDVLAKRASELFERAPLLRGLRFRADSDFVYYSDAGWDAATARACRRAFAALPRDRILAVSATAIEHDSTDYVTFDTPRGDSLVELIADAPALARLRELELDGGITTIGRLRELRELESFAFTAGYRGVGARALTELALRRLRVSGFFRSYDGLRGDELAELCETRGLERLTELDLGGSNLADADVVAIAGTPRLANLEALGLGRAKLGALGTAAVARSQHLRGLERLDLSGIASVDLPALASGELAAWLRVLNVSGKNLDDHDVDALLAMPVLETVTVASATVAQLARLQAAIPDVVHLALR